MKKYINFSKFIWDIRNLIFCMVYIMVAMVIFIKYPDLEVFEINIPNILFTFIPAAIIKILSFFILWSLVFMQKISQKYAKKIYTIICLAIFSIVLIMKYICKLRLTWFTILTSLIFTFIFWLLNMKKFNKDFYRNLKK